MQLDRDLAIGVRVDVPAAREHRFLGWRGGQDGAKAEVGQRASGARELVERDEDVEVGELSGRDGAVELLGERGPLERDRLDTAFAEGADDDR
ncbi:hypothetical protein LDC_1989 [sediment metagenome]|uniref:Uncharacterized protein n=1 Tax=sediment metagenome TaxID=749907 RepID=D9PKC4_9ZZZZ